MSVSRGSSGLRRALRIILDVATCLQGQRYLELVASRFLCTVHEFPASCCWKIIDIQVEESRCQYRSLWQAILLRPPLTADVTHVDTKSPLSQEHFNDTDGPTW